MKKTYLFLPVIVAAIILSACVENEVPDASPVTKSEMMEGNKPGMAWFPEEYEYYSPSSRKVDSIAVLLGSEYKFILMGTPSCTCNNSSAYEFPYIIKILDMAGSTEGADYELYTITSTRSGHPYEDVFDINDIPVFFLLKNEMPVYSIRDTMYWDALDTNRSDMSLEDYIIEALNQ